MKVILYFIVVVFFGRTYAVSQISSQDVPYRLYVCIDPDISLQFYNYAQEIPTKVPGIDSLMQAYHFSLRRGIDWPESTFDVFEAQTQSLGNSSIALRQLKHTYVVELNTYEVSILRFLALALLEVDGVKNTELMALAPVQPPFDIEPETPNFENLQSYLGQDPGMNIFEAWDLNITGASIRVRDVEYGFNKNHEELHMANCFIATGMTISPEASSDFTEHGTPVFGIMMADKGDYGVSGIVHDVDEMVLYPEWQASGYDRVFAVSQAIQASAIGDVILYEMQT
jgi:hypothetical protein